MKIGFSFSRCVRDIVAGRVALDDVLVVIGRTNFDPLDDQQWAEIWDGYCDYEWHDHQHLGELHFREIAIELYRSGRLHQPRRYGLNVPGSQHTWFEAVLPDFDLGDKPAVRKAWERFQVLARLSDVKLTTQQV